MLTDEYLEDFEDMGWTAENFLAAVRMARKRVEGIPSISELVSCHEEICRNPPRKPVAWLIGEDSLVKTPEMMEEGRFNCKVVSVMLSRGVSDKEAREIVLAEEKQGPHLRVVGGRV
ncbi:MAG: hypothetical protein OEV64_09220 [Desulfobulbaceae bacterium]|nr:hypothetical protein [Desulfobulbaceae bacterium]